MLYLLSLLNSGVNIKLLNSLLKSENEKDLLVSLASIKEFIRTPKIKNDNKNIKEEVIKQTEEMLGLEEKILSDFVDFSKVMVQKFDSVSVENGDLILDKDKDKIKIQIRGDENLVKKIIDEKYNKRLKLDKSTISLSELKTLPIIDYDKQQELKDYIDDLVFALYFNVGLESLGLGRTGEIKSKCSKNPYYNLVNNKK